MILLVQIFSLPHRSTNWQADDPAVTYEHDGLTSFGEVRTLTAHNWQK